MLLLTLAVSPAMAQKEKHEQWHKEMLEFKIKFLTKEMELNADQQKLFTPLYTRMMGEKQQVMRKARSAEKQLKKLKSPTDEDYKVVTDAIQKARNDEAAIEKKYDEKFGEFLSQKQIFRMKDGERKFRDRLMKMRDHGNGANHDRNDAKRKKAVAD